MNLIPAIGTYAAILKEAGQPLHYPGGPPRVGQAVEAKHDLISPDLKAFVGLSFQYADYQPSMKLT